MPKPYRIGVRLSRINSYLQKFTRQNALRPTPLGRSTPSKGEALIAKGRKSIEKGEDQVGEGRRLVAEGEALKARAQGFVVR